MTLCAHCKYNNKCKIKKLGEYDNYFDNHGNCSCYKEKGARISTKKNKKCNKK